MTPQQLLLALGTVIVTQCLTALYQTHHFDRHMDALNKRIDDLRSEMIGRIEALDKRLSEKIDALEKRLTDRLERLEHPVVHQ
jgi:hypothetical protein